MKTKEFSARDIMLGSTIDCSDHRREPRRPPAPDEGWRLIQAFTNIKDLGAAQRPRRGRRDPCGEGRGPPGGRRGDRTASPDLRLTRAPVIQYRREPRHYLAPARQGRAPAAGRATDM